MNGMADVEEEDGYSDDDLDALPSDAFLELQQRAIRSTQQSDLHAAIPNAPKERASPTLSDVLTVRGRPQELQGTTALAAAQQHPHQPSSDYGDLEDDALDGEILDAAGAPAFTGGQGHLSGGKVPGPSTRWEQWGQQRYASPFKDEGHPVRQSRYEPRLKPNLPQTPAISESGQRVDDGDDDMLDDPPGETPPVPGPIQQSDSVNILQARVEQLLRERESLQQVVREANNNVLAKAGEISIVRANQVKASKEYERQVAALQKSHADEAARQKAEIEATRAERERIATDNKFLRRDLVEESERTKILQRNAKDTNARAASTKAVTPKKHNSIPFRDGFDDDEILLLSPSKGSGVKAVTPKAGAKRKRKNLDDSPGQPLQLSQPKRHDTPDDSMLVVERAPVASRVQPKPQQHVDERFQFTQKILDHRIKHDQKRSFEALAIFAYPSKPEKALSTILLDKMSMLSFKTDIEDFPASVGLIVLSLWSQCMDEVFYEPLCLLMDLIRFILLISPPTTAPHLVDSLVQLAQLTADVNVIPRHYRKPLSDLKCGIDTNVCFQILHLCACGCARRQEDITRFWRCMRFDLVLMVLRIFQPIEDIQLMLNILRTSVLQSTFAMIVIPEKADQTISEHHVIDRVSAMLIEVPRVAEGEEPYDAVEIAEMRFLILDLMGKMCDSKHGAEALAKSPFAIGRLVRLMDDELNAVYDYKYGHEHRAELINRATRLLFHLTSVFPDINMQERLRVIPGGAHKHLIVLTRLAFSEGTFYERGIEDDVVDRAHQMLEDSVTPEEGEALLEAFSSARR